LLDKAYKANMLSMTIGTYNKLEFNLDTSPI